MVEVVAEVVAAVVVVVVLLLLLLLLLQSLLVGIQETNRSRMLTICKDRAPSV